MDDTQDAEHRSPIAPGVPVPAHASAAAQLWTELREYRRRHEAWERDVHRLLQAQKDLEARHWQLVLHAIECAAKVGEHEAATALLPPIGEGPTFDDRMALVERSLLDAGLARTGGCRRKAAALLGLLPTTLCEKLKRLGMARTH
jgi:DNA-binding NtrC family response regulator